MNRLHETIYSASPIFVQNILCSAYGWKLHHERYGGNFDLHLRARSEFERLDAAAIRAFQDRSLAGLVSFVAQDVQYYRELFRRIDLNPSRIRGLNDIHAIPFLEKETVRQNHASFCSEGHQSRRCVFVNTSGTTGTTLRIAVDLEARRANFAFFTLAKEWAGIKGFPRSVTFGGRLIVPQDQTVPPYWRSNWRANNTIFSSYHLSVHSITQYVEKLNAIRPVLVDSYPSSLIALVRLSRERRLSLPRPAAIITSSETLFPSMREEIEAAFQCRVYDQYGSAEQVAFASQCEKGSFHVYPDYGVVEIVDGEGRPCVPGEVGEVIATGFTNLAMPFLRFRTGDSAAWASGTCGCGRAFPRLESISGRVDDMLLGIDGRLVGRLDPVFKGMTSVREAQIAQTAADRVEIRIVPAREFDNVAEIRLVREVAARMGPGVSVVVRTVDTIPRGKGGKLRAVVREFQPARRLTELSRTQYPV